MKNLKEKRQRMRFWVAILFLVIIAIAVIFISDKFIEMTQEGTLTLKSLNV